MKVVVTQSAFDDLESVKEYYAAKGVPRIGEHLQWVFFKHILQLKTHPDLGRLVSELDTVTVRELIHPPFRIVNLQEETSVHIIRVWRSERLLFIPGKEKQQLAWVSKYSFNVSLEDNQISNRRQTDIPGLLSYPRFSRVCYTAQADPTRPLNGL